MSNLNGTATGTVWGVSILVNEPGGGKMGSKWEGTVSSISGMSGKETITAGTVTIELLKQPSIEIITFRVNGKDYGGIEVGDSLTIDADRTVTVNGEPREAT